ncbi:MAG: hypothetical protein LAO30_07325 [Acidobacteriia bacterium]|nr:hypothetical protein [Terriglobia bacterium]
MSRMKDSTRYLALLSRALLQDEGVSPSNGSSRQARQGDGIVPLAEALGNFGIRDFSELWTLATSHHVILRAFHKLHRALGEKGRWAEWIARASNQEQTRVDHALSFLAPICQALAEAGDVIVIKSLDHWPDLGSDLDLYTNANGADIVAVMREQFQARIAERSWGDRLANKWNFVVPGLPELVEVHVARLGQTGEQIAIAQSLIGRAHADQFGGYTFRVPAPEDRMIISTLQRMYRHFYIRLCDIVDNARLMDSRAVNYGCLKSLAEPAGLWDGLATYLAIVSEYVKSYRGEGLPLPAIVTKEARFGNDLVRFKRNFLRVPIFPQAVGLYCSEWKRLLLNGELRSTLRLSLLPGLATVAALDLKLTGSGKGIW